ncbi:MAG: hypothetical protein H0T92_19515 [Pyrinomonadaceae bacterium]|nr:hypothetical protein [Pyrinomonadaceae bacterium]
MSKINGRAYCFYNSQPPPGLSAGHIAAVDISNPTTPRKLWDVVVNPAGVDRGDVSHDGSKLFVPTFEYNRTQAYNLVLRASDGARIGTIPVPIQSHNTFVSLDGSLVWMENKKDGVINIDSDPYDLSRIDGRLRAASTATNKVVYTAPRFLDQGPYKGSKESGTPQPFVSTSDNQRIYSCVKGTYGFQWFYKSSNTVYAHNFTDQPYKGDRNYVTLHGLALKPDETEVWVADGSDNVVHVVDVTNPQRPVDKIRPGGGARVVLNARRSHWITFSLNGQYAYIAGPKRGGQNAGVFNTETYSQVDSIAPTEVMVEVDYGINGITAVGNQFGLGRK